MEALPEKGSTKGPAPMFIGDVWFDVIAKGEEPSRVRVNVARFAAGARTAWQSHAVGQTCTSPKASGWFDAAQKPVVAALVGR